MFGRKCVDQANDSFSTPFKSKSSFKGYQLKDKNNWNRCTVECWLPDDFSATRLIGNSSLNNHNCRTETKLGYCRSNPSTCGRSNHYHTFNRTKTRFSLHSRNCNRLCRLPLGAYSKRTVDGSAACRHLHRCFSDEYSGLFHRDTGTRFSSVKSTRTRCSKTMPDLYCTDWFRSTTCNMSNYSYEQNDHREELSKSSSTGRIPDDLCYEETELSSFSDEMEIDLLKCTGLGLLEQELSDKKSKECSEPQTEAERCWNTLWNNIRPADTVENESLERMRMVAGKLIQGFIRKIKMELECGKSESEDAKWCEETCGTCEVISCCPRGHALRKPKGCRHSMKEHSLCTTDRDRTQNKPCRGSNEQFERKHTSENHSEVTTSSSPNKRNSLSLPAIVASPEEKTKPEQRSQSSTLEKQSRTSIQSGAPGAKFDTPSAMDSPDQENESVDDDTVDDDDDDDDEEEESEEKTTDDKTSSSKTDTTSKSTTSGSTIRRSLTLTSKSSTTDSKQSSVNASQHNATKKTEHRSKPPPFPSQKTYTPVNSKSLASRNGKSGPPVKSNKSLNSSNRVDNRESMEQATIDPKSEDTLKKFATDIVKSLYSAILYKLSNLVRDEDENMKKEIMERGDAELKNYILPTIVEHIIWLIKEECRGQTDEQVRESISRDPGQNINTVITNTVMKAHDDLKSKRTLTKAFVVTTNSKQEGEVAL